MGGCILYCEYTGTVKSPYYYLFHLFRPLHYVVWACMLVVSVRGRCCSSWCTVMSFVFRRDPSHKQLRWCTDSCVVPWLSMAAHAPRPLHAQQLETFWDTEAKFVQHVLLRRADHALHGFYFRIWGSGLLHRISDFDSGPLFFIATDALNPNPELLNLAL